MRLSKSVEQLSGGLFSRQLVVRVLLYGRALTMERRNLLLKYIFKKPITLRQYELFRSLHSEKVICFFHIGRHEWT
jgi:hypothetical protein